MKINLDQFIKYSGNVDSDLLEKVEYNEILFCVAKTLLEYRKLFNYTQEFLAKQLDMTQVMISKLESGKYNISLKVLVKIWNKLSTKDYNFADAVLSKMLNKSKENYNIKYSENSYSYTLDKNIVEDYKINTYISNKMDTIQFKKYSTRYSQKMSQNNREFFNVI